MIRKRNIHRVDAERKTSEGKRSMTYPHESPAVLDLHPIEPSPEPLTPHLQFPFSRDEEVANTITHGAAMLLSLGGGAWLIRHSWGAVDPWYQVACIVFGLCMVGLYTSSTLYHGVQTPSIKASFRVCDHVFIYLMIAGSYTAFSVTMLRDVVGWTLLTVVWTMALWGSYHRIFIAERMHTMSAAPFLGMGWMALVAAKPIVERAPTDCLSLIVLGGLFYTAGVYFYVRDDRRYNHAIWHVFVMAGSACHFAAVLCFAAPQIAA
jgi:hemolysin III